MLGWSKQTTIGRARRISRHNPHLTGRIQFHRASPKPLASAGNFWVVAGMVAVFLAWIGVASITNRRSDSGCHHTDHFLNSSALPLSMSGGRTSTGRSGRGPWHASVIRTMPPDSGVFQQIMTGGNEEGATRNSNANRPSFPSRERYLYDLQILHGPPPVKVTPRMLSLYRTGCRLEGSRPRST